MLALEFGLTIRLCCGRHLEIVELIPLNLAILQISVYSTPTSGLGDAEKFQRIFALKRCASGFVEFQSNLLIVVSMSKVEDSDVSDFYSEGFIFDEKAELQIFTFA